MPSERAIPVPPPIFRGRARLRVPLVAVMLAIGGPVGARGLGTGDRVDTFAVTCSAMFPL